MAVYIFHISIVLKPNQIIKISFGKHYLQCQMYKPNNHFEFVCIMLFKINLQAPDTSIQFENP